MRGRMRVLRAGAAAALALALVTGLRPPGVVDAGGPTAAVIIKGPYLQQLTQTTMVIMWETDVATGSRVDYGLAAPNERFAEDSSPVTIHEMQLGGLQVGTTYRYQVTSGTATSATSTFTTVPQAVQPFRLVVYGDSRTNPAAHAAVVAGIIRSGPALVLHTGDLVGGGSYDEFGDEFFAPAHDLMLDTPLLPCLGNHENNSQSYYDLFSLPGNERWFAFTYGCTRIICLDTNADFSPGSAQHTWLVSELLSADFAKAPWRFVYFHHPPYSATSGHGDDWEVKTYLVPLFEQNSVHMVFAGHSHAYERYTNNGIPYIVAGGGGAPLYSLTPDTSPPIRQVGASVTHYVVVDVTPYSLRLSARRTSGKEFDSLELLRPNQPPAAAPDAYPTAEDTPLAIPAPGVLGNDSDPDKDPFTAVLVGGVSHGTLALNADGSFAYTPAVNFNGTDSFTYLARDWLEDSAPVTVTLTVTPVNDPPVARDDAALTEQGTAIVIPVLANDGDVDGDPLAVASVTQPAHGAAAHDGASATYTPAPGYTGTDSFTYTASDGQGGTATATVNLRVIPYARPDIFGRITGANGAGIAGVVLTLKGKSGQKVNLTATTDALGYYTFGSLPLGLYRVGPKLKPWKFAPKQLELTLGGATAHAAADFAGTTK